MGMARLTRTLALAAGVALLLLRAPCLLALDAPPRWLDLDSRCPWSPPVHGLSGRIVWVDLEDGQVFFELKNVSRQTLIVPWCIYCHDADGLRPRDGGLLPSGEQGSRCSGAQVVQLRCWDGTGTWHEILWPAEGAVPVAVVATDGSDGSDGSDAPSYDLMSRCALAAGERCLGTVARSPIEPSAAYAVSLTLRQPPGASGHWAGSLEMGPCPWFAPFQPTLSPTAERLPEHVAPLRALLMRDMIESEVLRAQESLNGAFQLNEPLSRAIATFRPADATAYYMGRVVAAHTESERCYLLAQAAALQTSDEALRKLTNHLRPMSELSVSDALLAISCLSRLIILPPWAMDRIIAAAASQAYVESPGGLEIRTLASVVEESSIRIWLTYTRQPAYRTELRRQVATQQSVQAALDLANYYQDPLAGSVLVDALRDTLSQLQQAATMTPQRKRELEGTLYPVINGAGQLRLPAAVPLLLQARQLYWNNGQIEQALSAIDDPTALPALQALRLTVAGGIDCGETLSPAESAKRVVVLDAAIASLQPDRSAALHALLARLGDQPQDATGVLDLLKAPPGQMSPQEMSQVFITSTSNAVCAWAAYALSASQTRAATAALIDCLASPNATREFSDLPDNRRMPGGSLPAYLAETLRFRSGCSLGTDAGLWRAWWTEVGSHQLGP